jgi:hypothetical protein
MPIRTHRRAVPGPTPGSPEPRTGLSWPRHELRRSRGLAAPHCKSDGNAFRGPNPLPATARPRALRPAKRGKEGFAWGWDRPEWKGCVDVRSPVQVRVIALPGTINSGGGSRFRRPDRLIGAGAVDRRSCPCLGMRENDRSQGSCRRGRTGRPGSPSGR